MWLRRQDLENMAVWAEQLGKALLLCQKFEATCKDIVSWFEIARQLNIGHLDILSDDYPSHVDRLYSLLLGQSISTLKSSRDWFGISMDDLSTLNGARESRNWVAHQSGLGVVFASHGVVDIDELVRNVTNVVRGDFLVSRWSYEFHEKESGNWKSEQDYLDMILNWLQDIS